MSRPRNDDRREQVQRLYNLTFPELITQAATIQHVAAALKISPHTVMYYLRGSLRTVCRPTFSEHVRTRVATMNLSEVKAYAAKLGRPWQRLYQISLDSRTLGAPSVVDARREEITALYKMLNFGSVVDLQCFGLALQDVKNAKKILRTKWGLTLSTPNLLVHSKGAKAYHMNHQEQVMILKNPEKYIHAHAAHIGANWKAYNELAEPHELLGLG